MSLVPTVLITDPPPPNDDDDDEGTSDSDGSVISYDRKSSPKLRKLRSEWSHTELNALIEGMREFGTSWAQIKSKYENVLYNRTPVQLKDKARSEKERRIKSDLPLGIFEIVK